MNEPRPSARSLAERVVASESGEGAAERLFARLHAGLSRLVGTHGVDVLIGRALRLVQKTEPALAKVTVAPHGVVHGFPAVDAHRLLTSFLTHLFELLIRFIGEDLVSRVIDDIWPVDSDGADPTETKT